MNAGLLRHLVTIQQPTLGSPTSTGARSVVWTTFARQWANIQPQNGRDLQYARTFGQTVTHKITMRFTAGILPTHRISYGSRIFLISAVTNNDERNRELDFYCTEQVA